MARVRRWGRAGRGIVPAMLALCGALGGAAEPAAAQPVPADGCAVPDSIHDALATIARRVGGEVGLAALHVESGARIELNGDRRFPMASVSKIPMALEFLRRVDAGQLQWDREIVVTPREFRAGHSPLAEWSGGRAVRLGLDSLFSLMVGASDNTATDVLLGMSGGPAAATRRVRELGVSGVEVDRSEARTFADLVGLPDTIPETELWRYQFFRLRDALPQAYRDAARERYGSDPRDTATPQGMTDLLARVHEGIGLRPESRARLLDVMAASRSGRRRMRGLLPPAVDVAHKTGTMAGAINDVGIVELPDGGHLIVSVFVNTLRSTTWRRERTIAEMTRLLYDHFSSGLPAAVATAGGGGSCADAGP